MDVQDYFADVYLRDGAPLHIRAIRPEDKQGLAEMFDRLSVDTIYYRFLGAKKELSEEELIYLTELDFHRRAALVAVLAEERQRIVAVARYACAPEGPDDEAELAITVEDAEQGRGIGTLLLRHLIRVARDEGIAALVANLLADNERTIRLLERTGRVTIRSAAGGQCHLVLTTAPISSRH
jgi:GNAT superfamily N-acetyltransferase